MTNLARGSVILTLVILAAIFFVAETKTEAALVIANDSKGSIQQNNGKLEGINLIRAIKEINLIENESDFAEIDNLIKTVAASNDRTSSGRSFTATAYCLKGRTASGAGVRRGIVAADPRVLRLGTRINLSAGAYSGNYLVADTGGAVKGRKLDIWVANCSEARRFGRRTVMVSR